MDKVIYKKESYEIVGCCFEVFNQLGPGHKEKTYQRALEVLFNEKNIKHISQFSIPIKINNKQIGRCYFDFLIDGKIVLELKVGDHFHRRDIEQIHSYLKSNNILLGILVNFTSNGAYFRRVLNIE
ncbi:MAG: hypothetical protein Athens101428_216 [Candidatus Berkelbacteria bacterium Athens1014_28]|uniref:GTP-binding signal recognition particle n=1 Tax=Candidatus Berkelbacteria bacterium Athens1014_28 TaxID=2017145 RepID=A0A554LP96_9BACT|nr:MAG: hypothetical protein Athens101428_216 [Candidatus Berkelbacteria bacterium Athens1014_28]